MQIEIDTKGFQLYKDRHGEQRCYHRATRTPIDCKKYPLGSIGFLSERDRIRKIHGDTSDASAGTLASLIQSYKASNDFLSLKERTRKDYAKCLEYLRPVSNTPLVRINRILVVKLRNQAGEDLGRKWGTYVKTTLSLLFSWGCEHGMMEVNPALGVKSLKKAVDAPEANRPWTDKERHIVEKAADVYFALPLALMMYCGLDPGDVCTLPRTAIAGGKINTKRNKTGEPVWVPLPSPVIAALAAASPHEADTLCANSRGEPWNYTSLDMAWQRLRAPLLKSGQIEPGLTLKGLRHTVATILAEIDYDGRSIADVLGQKTVRMGEHYSRRANKRKKLEKIAKAFESEVKRRRKRSV